MELTEEKIDLPRGANGLGFNIRGGIDVPHLKNDHGIFVTKIREIGTAYEDGRLKEGDKILEVNGVNVRNVTHNEAVQTFVKAGADVKLLVQHNAEQILKKNLEESEIKATVAPIQNTAKSGNKNNGIPFLKIIGISAVVIASVLLVKKYGRRPSSLNLSVLKFWQ